MNKLWACYWPFLLGFVIGAAALALGWVAAEWLTPTQAALAVIAAALLGQLACWVWILWKRRKRTRD